MKFKYEITGLDCPNCAAKLEGLIAKKDGLDSVKIIFITARLTVESEADEATVTDTVTKTAQEFSPKVNIAKK